MGKIKSRKIDLSFCEESIPKSAKIVCVTVKQSHYCRIAWKRSKLLHSDTDIVRKSPNGLIKGCSLSNFRVLMQTVFPFLNVCVM